MSRSLELHYVYDAATPNDGASKYWASVRQQSSPTTAGGIRVRRLSEGSQGEDDILDGKDKVVLDGSGRPLSARQLASLRRARAAHRSACLEQQQRIADTIELVQQRTADLDEQIKHSTRKQRPASAAARPTHRSTTLNGTPPRRRQTRAHSAGARRSQTRTARPASARSNDDSVKDWSLRPLGWRGHDASVTSQRKHAASSMERLSMYLPSAPLGAPTRGVARAAPKVNYEPRTQPKSFESFVTLQYVGNVGPTGPANALPTFRIDQHRPGAATLTVFDAPLCPKEIFTIVLARAINDPIGLTVYKNGIKLEQYSACCEHKYRSGARLGGATGAFRLIAVTGATPCVRCFSQLDPVVLPTGTTPPDVVCTIDDTSAPTPVMDSGGDGDDDQNSLIDHPEAAKTSDIDLNADADTHPLENPKRPHGTQTIPSGATLGIDVVPNSVLPRHNAADSKKATSSAPRNKKRAVSVKSAARNGKSVTDHNDSPAGSEAEKGSGHESFENLWSRLQQKEKTTEHHPTGLNKPMAPLESNSIYGWCTDLAKHRVAQPGDQPSSPVQSRPPGRSVHQPPSATRPKSAHPNRGRAVPSSKESSPSAERKPPTKSKPLRKQQQELQNAFELAKAQAAEEGSDSGGQSLSDWSSSHIEIDPDYSSDDSTAQELDRDVLSPSLSSLGGDDENSSEEDAASDSNSSLSSNQDSKGQYIEVTADTSTLSGSNQYLEITSGDSPTVPVSPELREQGQYIDDLEYAVDLDDDEMDLDALDEDDDDGLSTLRGYLDDLGNDDDVGDISAFLDDDDDTPLDLDAVATTSPSASIGGSPNPPLDDVLADHSDEMAIEAEVSRLMEEHRRRSSGNVEYFAKQLQELQGGEHTPSPPVSRKIATARPVVPPIASSGASSPVTTPPTATPPQPIPSSSSPTRPTSAAARSPTRGSRTPRATPTLAPNKRVKNSPHRTGDGSNGVASGPGIRRHLSGPLKSSKQHPPVGTQPVIAETEAESTAVQHEEGAGLDTHARATLLQQQREQHRVTPPAAGSPHGSPSVARAPPGMGAIPEASLTDLSVDDSDDDDLLATLDLEGNVLDMEATATELDAGGLQSSTDHPPGTAPPWQPVAPDASHNATAPNDEVHGHPAPTGTSGALSAAHVPIPGSGEDFNTTQGNSRDGSEGSIGSDTPMAVPDGPMDPTPFSRDAPTIALTTPHTDVEDGSTHANAGSATNVIEGTPSTAATSIATAAVEHTVPATEVEQTERTAAVQDATLAEPSPYGTSDTDNATAADTPVAAADTAFMLTLGDDLADHLNEDPDVSAVLAGLKDEILREMQRQEDEEAQLSGTLTNGDSVATLDDIGLALRSDT
eukprot:m.8362 g.8362  ORF g.8362 m.8362 type:complete len:1352 (+) comp6298_c0_seq1:237-4292(+)